MSTNKTIIAICIAFVVGILFGNAMVETPIESSLSTVESSPSTANTVDSRTIASLRKTIDEERKALDDKRKAHKSLQQKYNNAMIELSRMRTRPPQKKKATQPPPPVSIAKADNIPSYRDAVFMDDPPAAMKLIAITDFNGDNEKAYKRLSWLLPRIAKKCSDDDITTGENVADLLYVSYREIDKAGAMSDTIVDLAEAVHKGYEPGLWGCKEFMATFTMLCIQQGC